VKVIITDRIGNIPDHIKEYAEEKAENLQRLFDGTMKVEVVFSSSGNKSTAEMVLSAKKGARLHAQGKGDNLQIALDKMSDKMERQLTKFKEKLRSGKRHSAGMHPLATNALEDSASTDEDEEPTYEDIIKNTDIDI